MSKITPKNVTAQIKAKIVGNPDSSRLASTISNCFPGLETDFRNAWIRMFKGLTFIEATGVVAEATDPALEHLVGRVLVAIEFDDPEGNTKRVSVVATIKQAGLPSVGIEGHIEWGNALAEVIQFGGQTVKGLFHAPPTVTASSGQDRTYGLSDSLAFSGLGNVWYSDPSATPRAEYLIFDFGAEVDKDKLRLASAGPSQSVDLSQVFPRQLTIQASDDPNTWPDSSTVAEFTDIVPMPGQWNEFSFPLTNARYFRISFDNLSNLPGFGFLVLIAELQWLPRRESAENLVVNDLFMRSNNNKTGVLDPEIVEPGMLSQGLCSPWQNDYLECACFYWAASRPDYVNVLPGEPESGHNWFEKNRSDTARGYNGVDSDPNRNLISYTDIFVEWERHLRFIRDGVDSE